MKFKFKKIAPVALINMYFTYNGTPFKIIKKGKGELFYAWYDKELRKVLTNCEHEGGGMNEEIWNKAIVSGKYKIIHPMDAADNFIYGVNPKLREFKL